ncbi:hypothetical protein [Propionibacterium freudenreichii]|uniref:hypothetical protein n=1 Tax=Propionibacterium freudenreichii TaxID=1744 RepID=UPI00155DAAF0|nr:hypothetical protein [Propionibacterium freudenreichii]
MLHNFRRIRTLDVGFRACCDGEWFREVEGCFLVFVDVDAGDEGLVGEALPVWVGVLVEALAVDQGSQGFHNLFAGSWLCSLLMRRSMPARPAQMQSWWRFRVVRSMVLGTVFPPPLGNTIIPVTPSSSSVVGRTRTRTVF